MNRFRNGYIRPHLSSVVFEEIVRNGGFIREFFEGFFCDNLDYDPFERFVFDMTAKEMETKKRKETYYKLRLKKVSNAVYGYVIKSDIGDVYKYVSSHWMKTE